MTTDQSSASAPFSAEREAERRRQRPRFRRSGTRKPVASPSLLPALPTTAITVAFFLVPFGVFVYESLLTNRGFTRASRPFTLENYTEIFSPAYGAAAANSVRIGLTTATVTVTLGLIVSYWLRYRAGRLATPVLLLIIATLFSSYLVRIYAWRTVLGDHGVINSGLESAGVIDMPLDFLIFNRLSVVLAETHLYLPLIVLLIHNGFRPLVPAYLEAARDLGTGPVRLWTRVILPAIAKPLSTAFVLVFLFASSDFMAPAYLGGEASETLSVRVQESFTLMGNWAGGAALSLTMVAGYALLYLIVVVTLKRLRVWDLRWVN